MSSHIPFIPVDDRCPAVISSAVRSSFRRRGSELLRVLVEGRRCSQALANLFLTSGLLEGSFRPPSALVASRHGCESSVVVKLLIVVPSSLTSTISVLKKRQRLLRRVRERNINVDPVVDFDIDTGVIPGVVFDAKLVL